MSSSNKKIPPAMVGIDIGIDSIKVAEAKYNDKDGITITGLGIARTPIGVIENEMIVDPKGLGDAIKTLLNDSGIKTKKCVSSVAGQSKVVVRVIDVP
jgi:Tfp pilus assembly PilM family ATPase